jgi:hypothetical protein
LTPELRRGHVGDGLTSVAAAFEQARAADETLRHAVDEARALGRTWQEIGDALGTSRQAAYQRFGRPVIVNTPRAEPALPDAADKAVALLADLIAGRWTDARRDFDARLTATLTTGGLVAAWTETVGTCERMGEPGTLRVGGYTVVDVPLHGTAGDLTARVSFDDDGAVAGLYLLPG